MAKFKKTNFKTGVKKNTEKMGREESKYGYLNLPREIHMYTPVEGRAKLDFLPYVVKMENHPDRDGDLAAPGTLWYKLPFRVHRQIGTAKENIVCPTTFGKRCPICEYRAKRGKDGAEKDEMDSLKMTRRNLYAVVPIGDKKQEEVPHVWDVSDYLFQQMLNKELLEDDDYAMFPDLEEGYTLDIRFEEGSFGKNQFIQANRIDFKKRKEAWEEDILDDVPCLDNLLIVYTYKELEAKLFEMDAEEPEEEVGVEEEKPTRKRKTVEPEPEEDPDEEEPEPSPVRKRRSAPEPEPAPTRRRRQPEPDPDEEPELDDEEPELELDDEEPAPVKKRKTPAPAAPAKGGKTKCPAGHKWGTADNHPECADCTIWDDCVDAAE